MTKLPESDLPITEVIPEVLQQLQSGNTLIVSAPPGAGKSTLLPLALLDEAWREGRKIIMLEPRRLAAKGIAARMADLLGEKVGDRIGYRIRFETRVSDKSIIEVVTEGILTRMLHSDNELSEAALVIFDEFHERSIHADVALALCRECQDVLRPDLKLLIMSATLDVQALQSMLAAPVVESQGRQFPVEHIYVGDTDVRLMAESTTAAVLRAVQEKDGDVLVFLPGQAEIERCVTALEAKLPSFRIHALYGALPFSRQRAAILPDTQGRRKVVVATSIAETSLTIEGIRIVVDSGFGRVSKFDPRSGLTRLETVHIAKDSADQRAGRAGRLSAGTCYRLWTKATHLRLSEHRRPEIMEADLCSLALDLHRWGISDISAMAWLTPPPEGPLKQAVETLTDLDALALGRITDHGRRLHELPCHPRLAHMLVSASDDGEEALSLACDIAAILEERDPLGKEAGIDINLRLDALKRQRTGNLKNRKLARIEQVSKNYRRIFGISPNNEPTDPFETGVLLVHAYPERIAMARPGNNAQFQLSNGRYAMAGHKDDLAYESWLAIAHIDARDGMGKIFLASPLNPRDLAPMVKERKNISWDTKKGGFIAERETHIGNIVLQSRPLDDVDEGEKIAAICEALTKEGKQLLDFTDEVEQWQNRVLSLKKWRPEEDWPDVSTPTLLATVADWLGPYLNVVRKVSDLKKLDLASTLQHHLPYQLQGELNRLAPKHIEVPSGSQIKLEYQANGSPPILAVRLQEVFGLAYTPHVNDGRTPVLMHLLSPGFKPVQITSDLRSFWNETYFEVRKELRRRYVKHSWPDDPWSAEAVRGVKRKKS